MSEGWREGGKGRRSVDIATTSAVERERERVCVCVFRLRKVILRGRASLVVPTVAVL